MEKYLFRLWFWFLFPWFLFPWFSLNPLKIWRWRFGLYFLKYCVSSSPSSTSPSFSILFLYFVIVLYCSSSHISLARRDEILWRTSSFSFSLDPGGIILTVLTRPRYFPDRVIPGFWQGSARIFIFTTSWAGISLIKEPNGSGMVLKLRVSSSVKCRESSARACKAGRFWVKYSVPWTVTIFSRPNLVSIRSATDSRKSYAGDCQCLMFGTLANFLRTVGKNDSRYRSRWEGDNRWLFTSLFRFSV